ncbi:M48 family metallopeptidase [Undibacter mobilis]|uniref:M48 family peptidase n=1 Tax=Undibacter mobilis TaxID=2292256 RepID=A0A371B938_9BRAD|nr:SprT family zinc-dependent metalloprotease [Undibacter mobilis]RDV03891.1 M48 family peptidase [Undibacter mobilis]
MSLPFRALFSRRASEPSIISISFGDEIFDIALRRNAQARRFTLRVQSARREVVLTLPPRGSLKQARDFAERNAAWIATRLARLPQPIPFVDGAVVPLRGTPHLIVHRPQARGAVWTEAEGEAALLCVAGEAPHVARRIRDYLKKEARRDLDIASRRAASALGVTLRRVSVRDQSSRWGSCSTTGVLSYSWRLILTPPFVLEYLAAHEAAHLVEMNHSRAFWRQVERICPDFRRAKSWLDVHGAELHRYGNDA